MGVAAALDGVDGVEGSRTQGGVFVVGEGELDVVAFGDGSVELTALLELPRDESYSVEVGVRKLTGEAAQGCAETAAHIEDTGFGFARQAQTAHDLVIHLLKHRFATEGVHAPAEEAEVHVEGGAPGGVVGAGLFVVPLE